MRLLSVLYVSFLSQQGDHRDLHVLTHAFPDRLASVLIFARAARESRTMSGPSEVTQALPGVTMPQTMLISVVLPAPLGPSRAKISPRRISRSIDLSAWKPEASVLPSALIEMMGCMRGPVTFAGAGYRRRGDPTPGRRAAEKKAGGGGISTSAGQRGR